MPQWLLSCPEPGAREAPRVPFARPGGTWPRLLAPFASSLARHESRRFGGRFEGPGYANDFMPAYELAFDTQSGLYPDAALHSFQKTHVREHRHPLALSGSDCVPSLYFWSRVGLYRP